MRAEKAGQLAEKTWMVPIVRRRRRQPAKEIDMDAEKTATAEVKFEQVAAVATAMEEPGMAALKAADVAAAGTAEEVADMEAEQAVADTEAEQTVADTEAEQVAAKADAMDPGPRWSPEQTEEYSCVELARVRGNRRDPPNPASGVRESGDGKLLDEMELACCFLQYEAASTELPLPRFRVTARPSRILEPELRQMAIVLRKALDREEPFTILWDLRRLVPPSISALDYGAKWQGANAGDIERLGESITVLVSSPVTRICANLCVRVCNPPQPVRICTDEPEAAAFAREQYLRLRGGACMHCHRACSVARKVTWSAFVG